MKNHEWPQATGRDRENKRRASGIAMKSNKKKKKVF